MFEWVRQGFSRVRAWLTRGFPNLPFHLAFGQNNLTPHSAKAPFPFQQNSTVYACVRKIGENVAKPQMVTMRGTRENQSPAGGHPLEVVWSRPNPRQSKFEFWELTSNFLDTEGEAFWLMPDRTRPEVYPATIWAMSPRFFQPITDDRNMLQGWKMRTKGGEVTFPLWQVLQLRFPHPTKPHRGLAPITAARLGVEVDMKAQLFNNAFFDNGADPGGFLKVDRNLGDKEFDSLKRRWEMMHRGPENAHRFQILEGAVEYQQVQVSMSDMQFIEQRNYTRDEVLMVFGCPQEVVGLGKRTFENVDQAWRHFWKETLDPRLVRIEDAITWHVHMPVDGGRFFSQFDRTEIPELQDELNEKLDQAAKLLAVGYTPNQVNERLELGMPEVEWGDQPLFQFRMADDQFALGGPEAEEDDEEDEDEEEARALPGKPTVLLLENLARNIQFDALLSESLVLEKRMFNRIKLHLNTLKAQMLRNLDNLDTEKAVKEGDEDGILFDLGLADETVRRLTQSVFQQSVSTGARTVLGELGLSINIPTPQSILDIATARTIRIVGINSTARKILRGQIAEDLREQKTPGEVASGIRKRFGQLAKQALTIARTEVQNSINQARFQQMNERGVTRSKWLTAQDEVVRESHKVMHGQERDLGQTFTSGNGVALRFPGDPQAPGGEVINCRCRTIPILEDD